MNELLRVIETRPDIVDAIEIGKPITAIKILRNETGSSLYEAKNAVVAYRDGKRAERIMSYESAQWIVRAAMDRITGNLNPIEKQALVMVMELD